MHTPPTPSPSSPEGGGASVEDAQVAITAVLTWYSRQMMTARRAGDQQRQEKLAEQLQAVGRDQERLGDAGPGEIARITELYTGRLKHLEADENN